MSRPAKHLPETQQKVKFYQTGTFTVGNRLLDDATRSRILADNPAELYGFCME